MNKFDKRTIEYILVGLRPLLGIAGNKFAQFGAKIGLFEADHPNFSLAGF